MGWKFQKATPPTVFIQSDPNFMSEIMACTQGLFSARCRAALDSDTRL